jgi:hypothetical protein
MSIPRSKPWWPLAVAATLTAGVVALVAVWPRQPPLPRDAARQLVRDANVAVAELENQSLDAAVPLLESIAAALPDDPFGPRNLAVARIVALGDGPGEEQQLNEAVAALQSLATREGSTTALRWLSAKLAMLAGDPSAAAAAFEQLVAESPDDAAAWYGLWRARSAEADVSGAEPAELSDLTTACEADPRNLWLAVEWLRAASLVVDRGLLAGDDAATQVEQRWPAIAPFAPAVLAFTKTDVRGLLDRAVTALEAADRGLAAGSLRGLANLLVPQAAADRAAVDPHPLEFVIERLAARVIEAASDPADDAGAIPVAFTAALLEPFTTAADASTAITAVLLEDIDLDGRTDVTLLTADGIYVLTATGSEWQASLSAEMAAAADGLLAVDLDLDFDEAKRQAEVAASSTDSSGLPSAMRRCPAADLDLVAYGSGGIAVLENRLGEDGTSRELRPFERPMPTAQGRVRAMVAADLEADGPIDLVSVDDAGLRIWRNQGSQGFVEATPADGMPPVDFGITAMLAVDFDRDVDVELVVAGEGGVGLVENLRHGQLRFRPLNVAGRVTGLELIDANADGRWDLAVAGPDGLRVVLHEELVGGPRGETSPWPVDPEPTGGVIAFDYDNDGRLDLLSWSDRGPRLWRGTASGFAKSLSLPADLGEVRAADAADLDGDGDLDLVVAGDEARLLTNDGGNANHWLAIDLEAQQIKGGDFAPSGRVNAHGLGSLLELKAGSLYQPRCVRRRTTHFGLGPRGEADAVRVLWLNGVPQNVVRPPADLLICEQQILLGSCPYLYAWDGSGYRFVTDLLWAAPLGLQRSAGELVPDRPQEFLSIPRGALVAADGEYRLQITEELWEAAYFDEVTLLVIDHPAGVEVFSNEKVGPPEIARFGLHTVATRRIPRAARTGDGRDVLPLLAAEDGDYLPPSGRKLRQGLTERHTLELDLGPVDDTDRLTLFLTGWMYPTTVGQNLALGRDPALGLPQPPTVSVPDGSGGWKTVLPMMGFPGGKTKTIAVDLAGLVPADDPRVRIETSMEIAWDAIFFTSGEPPTETGVTELRPLSADLHDRGFSRIEQPSGAGPERFHYDDVDATPKWPPMQGAFTRYGDVRELLAARDDRLVVMAAGDEMTLRFAAPPGPPAGQERAFILMSVGWDKDANLATAVGDTVEPLPFTAMRSYPPGPDDTPPDSEAYRAYLQKYQTRHQDRRFWQAVRRGTSGREVVWDQAGGSSSAP